MTSLDEVLQEITETVIGGGPGCLPSFALKTTRMLTTKLADGRYRKLNYSGNTWQFRPIGWYEGKKVKHIIQFQPLKEGSLKHNPEDGIVEMNPEQAKANLDGFAAYMNDLQANLERLTQGKEEKQEELVEQAREIYGDKFGSW